MGVFTGIVTFVMVWWTVFFAVLPIGVRSQVEDGSVVEGSEPGAPAKPQLWMKIGLTTALSAVVWLAIVIILQSAVFSLADGAGESLNG